MSQRFERGSLTASRSPAVSQERPDDRTHAPRRELANCSSRSPSTGSLSRLPLAVGRKTWPQRGEIEELLARLQLSDFGPKLFQYGVQQVADIKDLQTADLEELGMTRIQIRRLQSATEPPVRDTSEPPSPSRMKVLAGAAKSALAPLSASRPRGARSRSASQTSQTSEGSNSSFGPRSVTFGGSVYSQRKSRSRMRAGDVERLVTSAIVDNLSGRGNEVTPRSLGLSDCSLALRVTTPILVSNFLPGVLTWTCPEQLVEGSIPPCLLLVMVKTHVQRLSRAADQLQRRLDQLPEAERDNVQLMAVVQANVDDDEDRMALQEAAQMHEGLHVVAVNVKKLRVSPVPSDSEEDRNDCLALPQPTAVDLLMDAAGKLHNYLPDTNDPQVRASAVGAGTGAVAGGVVGGTTGAVSGAVVGGAVGIVPALFTFGLSIPVCATIGGSIGLCSGTAVGSSVGAIGGGAAGYRYASTEDDLEPAVK